jgi:hypothetical protein
MKKALALGVVLLSGALAGADHLPANLLAKGKRDTVLAGIDLASSNPDEVRRKFGPPTKTVKAPNNPGWTGYLWQASNTLLEVEVTKGKTRDYVDTVTVVRRNGETPTSVWTIPPPMTGRGLKLGDTIAELTMVYGSKFKFSKQAKVPVDTDPFLAVAGSETAVVQWAQLEFTLTAGFDEHGQIIALRLSPPECYPGGCE